MEALAGVWQLAEWCAVWAVEFDGPADEFLYQDPAVPLDRFDDAGEVRGSALTIHPDGCFSQSGECDRLILTYDEQGVQISGMAGFSGVVREDDGRVYLLTNGTAGRLRVDNGDTRICDSVRLVGERLVRTICVITDECYGDRVVLVYNPSSARPN